MCLIKYHTTRRYTELNQHAINTYRGSGVLVHPFVSSALDGGCKLYAEAALPPAERVPFTHLGKMLGGPQSRSGRGGKEKKFYPFRESKPGHVTHTIVTLLTELCWGRLGYVEVTLG
jgi:hypothetical protein